MGTTTTGLPYPEPTDPVSQGADNIKALANAIDPRLPVRTQTGVATVSLTAVSTATAAVTLTGFTNTPRVVTNIYNGVSRLLTSRAQSISTTGFTAWVGVANTTDTLTATCSLNWIAVQTAGAAAAARALPADELAADEGWMQVSATCTNPECPDNGVAIVLTVPDGSDPDMPAPSSYWCGTCGTEITDVSPA